MKRNRTCMAGLSGLCIVCLLSGCGSHAPLKQEINNAQSANEKTLVTEASVTDQTVLSKESEDSSLKQISKESVPQETGILKKEETLEQATDPGMENNAMEEEPTSEMIEEQTSEMIEETATQIIIPGIEACLIREHYAGDVLTARDFQVKVTMENGTVLMNPRGWTAEPLSLAEGENRITVCYGGFVTELTINAVLRPEGVVESQNNPEPGVSFSSSDFFSLRGSSVLTKTEDRGQAYLDQCIFLGDSRTYSYQAYGVLAGGRDTTQVWTPSCRTMTLSSQSYISILYPDTGSEISIRDAVAMKKPVYLVIGLGTNGVSYMNENSFKNEFRSLITDIQQISPDTKIILNSIFPVADFYARLDLINNEKISQFNRWMMEVAEETQVRYLNTVEALATADGFLNPAYCNGGDGLHLNRLGDEIVMQYIRTHGYQ